MTPEVKEAQLEQVEIKAGTTKGKENEYNLSLEVENAHVTLTTYPWSYRKGNNTDITIFSLTPDQIKETAEAILEQYYKIKEVK